MTVPPRDVQGEPPVGGRSGSAALGALLVATGRGDHEAFAELYDALAARAHGVILTMLPQRDLAAGALHEVFLEVWRSAARFDPTLDDPTTWVLRIAHRRAVVGGSSVSATRPGQIVQGGAVDAASGADPEARPLLPRGYDLLAQIHLAGRSYDDIAGSYDVPVRDVKAAARAALTQQQDLVDLPPVGARTRTPAEL